jgi:hypothetical protein
MTARAIADSPISRFLDRLLGVKKSGRGWIARCPAHEDHSPSLSVNEGDDGCVLAKCHAGCSFDAIVTAAGLRKADLFPAPRIQPRAKGPKGRKQFIESYDYVDADGRPLFQVRRYQYENGEKAFDQWRSDGRGGWLAGLGETPRVLYRLPEVLAAVESGARVFVVEGEKDANALATFGFTATTNPGGADKGGGGKKWRESMSAALAGADVVILPDNDDPGHAHAERVAASLVGHGATVRVVGLPGLKEKGDISDWLGAGGTIDALAQLVDRTERWVTGAAADLSFPSTPRIGLVLTPLSEIEARPVRWLWPQRIPLGAITMLDGTPGLGKSQLTLDLAARVSRGDRMGDGTLGLQGDVILLTAEDALAQTIRPRLDALGADTTRIHDLRLRGTDGAGHGLVFPNDFSSLREALARLPGCRLIVIDTLSAFLGSEVNSFKDQDVRRVLSVLKDIAEEFDVAVVCIRHLNKSRGGSALNRGGGSIAFAGAARSVLLCSNDPAYDSADGRRVLASVKNNLAREAESLAFHLETVDLPGLGSFSHVVFDGLSHHRADALVDAQDEDQETKTAIDAAGEFLAEFLRGGPQRKGDVLSAAQAKQLARRTVERAAHRMNLRTIKGFGTDGSWGLPFPRNLASGGEIETCGANGTR